MSIRSTIVAMTPEAKGGGADSRKRRRVDQDRWPHLVAPARRRCEPHRSLADCRIIYSKAFEVGDQSFAAVLDELTPEGERRANIFARMMAQVRALQAQIIVSSKQTDTRLEKARAERLRRDLIAKGVQPSRIELPDEPIDGGAALSRKPELVVVLTD